MSADALAFESWATPVAATTLREWQAGRCAACGESDRLVKDHCHLTGLVRGLLCSGCNTWEGSHRDARWDAWRNGHNAAAAVGIFEVYKNSLGVTPLAPQSALIYYTRDEQQAWWRSAGDAFAAGGIFPAEAPWSPEATARRDAEWAALYEVTA